MVDIIFDIVVLIVAIITIANVCDILRTFVNKKLEIDKFKAVSEQSIDPNDLNILDQLINEAFVDYRTLHFDYINADESYITAEDQKKMILELLETVLETVSENLYTKLSLYYKKDYINDIIYKKIQMVVLGYTIEINGQKK